MENCPHINSVSSSVNENILDPSRWQCSVCGTTEWVWACLSCGNIACGRMNEQHAEQHFCSSKHPLAVEINEKYVYCYICDEYVLGDNSRGDIEVIRSALTDIGTLSLEEVKHKGGTLLKSFSHQQEFSRNQADENDRLVTAICHHRKSLIGKVWAAWQAFILSNKESKMKVSTTAIPSMMTRARKNLFHVKKRTLIPGVTGLRNLGNTCYINSIVQALGHLEDFREFFCQIIFGLFSPTGTPLPGNSPNSSTSPLAMRSLLRLNTIDYFQHLSNGIRNTKQETNKKSSNSPSKSRSPQKSAKSPLKENSPQQSSVNMEKVSLPSQQIPKGSSPQTKLSGGLNGGGSEDSHASCLHLSTSGGSKFSPPDLVSAAGDDSTLEAKAHVLKALSLCQEMHGVLRVLWSGKWAQVSPHGFLQAVWRAIPVFKGHLQHDAQEFLCELLDKMSQEIEKLPQCKGMKNMIDQSFRGEFVSQVTCMACKNISSTYEPFLDVSLEFPRRFQSTSSQIYRNMCHVTEMLSSFTGVEDLEPLSYNCENCNKNRRRASRQKERRTDAKKQLLFSQCPDILRLHLKRFRWCGRNNREKIGTHVMFDEELDLSPFCDVAPLVAPLYRLSAVVVHQGAGFRAGHYTAYAYNNSAGSWLHCNDSRVQLVPLEEVLASQAYILFYTRQMASVSLEDLPSLSTREVGESDRQSNISTLPDMDADTLQTLQRGETQHCVDDEVVISFHRNPTLLKRLSSSTPTVVAQPVVSDSPINSHVSPLTLVIPSASATEESDKNSSTTTTTSTPVTTATTTTATAVGETTILPTMPAPHLESSMTKNYPIDNPPPNSSTGTVSEAGGEITHTKSDLSKCSRHSTNSIKPVFKAALSKQDTVPIDVCMSDAKSNRKRQLSGPLSTFESNRSPPRKSARQKARSL